MADSTFDPTLAAVSCLLGVVTFFTALELTRSVARANISATWLAVGAVSTGAGLWSTLCIGAFAFSSASSLLTGLPLWAVGLVIAVVVSAALVYVGSRDHVSRRTLTASGAFLGAGMAGLHAVSARAALGEGVVYNGSGVILSAVLAGLVAMVAVTFMFVVAQSGRRGLWRYKLVTALVLGASVSGLHHAGLGTISVSRHAAAFNDTATYGAASVSGATAGVVFAALMALGVTCLAVSFERRVARERRRTENALNDMRCWHQTFEDVPSEIYVFSADTLRFVRVNAVAARHLGYARHQFLTMTPLDVLPDVNVGTFRARLTQLVMSGTGPLVFAATHRRADGSLYPVTVSLRLFSQGVKPLYVAVAEEVIEAQRVPSHPQVGERSSAGPLAAVASLDPGRHAVTAGKKMAV